jgi:hypothetical protein
MGRLDQLEYARYPNNGAVRKSVGYSIATAYTQVDLGRGTRDALWAPPVHQVLWLSPRSEELLWCCVDSPPHNECRGELLVR